MILPKELRTITPLSKGLAMILFIVLPFLGFYLGMQYQQSQDLLPLQVKEQSINIPINKITPTSSESTDTSTINLYDITIDKPEGWKITKTNNSLSFLKNVSGYYPGFFIEVDDATISSLNELQAQRDERSIEGGNWIRITIDKNEALVHTYVVPMVAATSNTDIYFFSNDKKKMYKVSQDMNYIDSPTVKKYRDELMQIVGTIKFANQTETTISSGQVVVNKLVVTRLVDSTDHLQPLKQEITDIQVVSLLYQDFIKLPTTSNSQGIRHCPRETFVNYSLSFYKDTLGVVNFSINPTGCRMIMVENGVGMDASSSTFVDDLQKALGLSSREFYGYQ